MEEYGILEILLLLLAGITAGIVNTLAGSGTIASIGSLLFLDIPIDLANTTNRFGVFFQNLSAVYSFKRFSKTKRPRVPIWLMLDSLLGAMLGAWFAATISTSYLEYFALLVIGGMMLYTILDIMKVRVKTLGGRIVNPFVKIIIFFLIGVYGGFIQIGVGILMLIGIRQTFGLDWTKANFFKLWIILIYTIPTTIYFGVVDMIVWVPGIILALGQLVSAFFTGWLFTISERTRRSIPYIVLLMLVITAVKIVFF